MGTVCDIFTQYPAMPVLCPVFVIRITELLRLAPMSDIPSRTLFFSSFPILHFSVLYQPHVVRGIRDGSRSCPSGISPEHLFFTRLENNVFRYKSLYHSD